MTIAELVEEARQRRYEIRDDVQCSICGAPGTNPVRYADGFHYRIEHLGYCPIGKLTALAAGPRPVSFEPAELDDRRAWKR